MSLACPTPVLRLAGLGMQRSKGVKAGVLTDLDEAESVVRGVIGQAERAAGISVGGFTLSVSAGRISSVHCTARTEVETGCVTEDDLARLMAAGESYAERNGRTLLHLNHLGYEVDGARRRARSARAFGATTFGGLHAVTADEAPLRNLLVLIDRCYASCDGLVAAPYASALAATTPEERQFGVTCIDFGAGTTSIALFSDGRFTGTDVIPVGSQHITYDIAKALQTPLAEAERIKTLYGTMLKAQSDEHELFSYPIAGEEDDGELRNQQGAAHGYHPSACAADHGACARAFGAQCGEPLRGRQGRSDGRSQPADRIAGICRERIRALGASRAAVGFARSFNASLSGPQLATLSGLAIVAARGDGELNMARGRKTVNARISWSRRNMAQARILKTCRKKK